MTDLANKAFAQHTTFFLAEHIGIDPTTALNVHEVMPPVGTNASLDDEAPTTMAPFTVMENDDVKVSAILVARRGLPGVRLPLRHRPRQRRVLGRHGSYPEHPAPGPAG